MANRTLREILKLSPEERKQEFQVSKLANKNIDIVKIDEITFTDYSAFTFLMEKTFVKSPTRSSDGSIPDLDTYAWFLTPHLKMDFSLMSIDAYRNVMKLIQSKNEFTVTCYDVVNDKNVTHQMYFATEQMPKLWTIARRLNGSSDAWIELLGVNDYTIELIGTNVDVQTNRIIYNLNVPQMAEWGGATVSKVDVPSNLTTKLNASFNVDATNSNSALKNINEITFNSMYKFKYWAENADGSGFKYSNDNEYRITSNLALYAIWERGA